MTLVCNMAVCIIICNTKSSLWTLGITVIKWQFMYDYRSIRTFKLRE